MIELNFDTTERDAATALGISPDTLKAKRLSGVIPLHCYTKFGYKLLRYCLPLLQDWQIDPTDTAAQARANEQLQNSRVSNLPRKQGRKAA